jgi:hypothetical protein
MSMPRLLLTIAVRWMPAERAEWGAAMLAELAQLQNPFTCWQFALGCARVALFPPRKGRQTMMNQTKPSTTFGAAALMSLILVVPFVVLELWYNTNSPTPQYSRFPTELFGILWFLGTVFLLTVAPVVRTVRAGDSILVHSITLLFRLVFVALVGYMWVGIIIDQLPCFLGVPNCD